MARSVAPCAFARGRTCRDLCHDRRVPRTSILSLTHGVRGAVMIAVLAACGPPPKPAAPPKSGPTCADAAAHMVDEMAATKDPRPPDEALNGLIALIRTRCEQDRWTSE